jgi:hypothetical protein
MARRCEKWGFWLWIFAKRREIGGVYWSVIGHRLRVGAMGGEGQGAGVVQPVWMGVEMWERGPPASDSGSGTTPVGSRTSLTTPGETKNSRRMVAIGPRFRSNRRKGERALQAGRPADPFHVSVVQFDWPLISGLEYGVGVALFLATTLSGFLLGILSRVLPRDGSYALERPPGR